MCVCELSVVNRCLLSYFQVQREVGPKSVVYCVHHNHKRNKKLKVDTVVFTHANTLSNNQTCLVIAVI